MKWIGIWLFPDDNQHVHSASAWKENLKAPLWVKLIKHGGPVPLRCPPAVREQWWACPGSVCPRRCRCPGGRPRARRGGPLGSRSYHRPHDKTTWGAAEGRTDKWCSYMYNAGVCFNRLGSSAPRHSSCGCLHRGKSAWTLIFLLVGFILARMNSVTTPKDLKIVWATV